MDKTATGHLNLILILPQFYNDFNQLRNFRLILILRRPWPFIFIWPLVDPDRSDRVVDTKCLQTNLKQADLDQLLKAYVRAKKSPARAVDSLGKGYF